MSPIGIIHDGGMLVLKSKVLTKKRMEITIDKLEKKKKTWGWQDEFYP
jgi:hypothetical protein